jgi:hypothetical protein
MPAACIAERRAASACRLATDGDQLAGSLQIRLYDVATRNQRIGLGGCTEFQPAFDGDGPMVIGVV